MSVDPIAQIAELVARESGVVIAEAQRSSLVAAIARVAPGMTATRLLAAGCPPEAIERLIDEVTVRETFFFRHRAELDTIDWHGALQAARARGTDVVRVWIAGCASGEEAYTMAILACEAFGSATPPVRILATDIAPTALAQARRGQYGARAVRTLDDRVRRRYFDTENQTLSAGRSLRALVEVRRHNLVRDSIPPVGSPPFDVILCRNVLIYFDRDTVDRVAASLEGALWPGGRLVLGAADRLSGAPRPIVGLVPGGGRMRRNALAGVPKAPIARPSVRLEPVAAPGLVSAGVPALVTAPADATGSTRRQRLSEAMRAADRGDLDVALQIAAHALTVDPLDAEANFITGVAELARERPRAAIGPLRRALYADPTSGLAAFKLARAHDSLGEMGPARRAYEQALRTLELNVKERPIAETRELAEITEACRTRLRVLESGG
jgi:chemotaxis protein methyltransferase CheR